MRIALVTPILSWNGGLQEYVAGIAHGLDVLGHDVTILTGGRGPAGGTPAHPLAQRLDVRWHPRRPIAGRVLYPIGMRRSLRELTRSADVVHAFLPFAP